MARRSHHRSGRCSLTVLAALAATLSTATASRAQLCEPALEQTLTPFSGQGGKMGHSVDIDGDRLLAGAPELRPDPGAFVFRYDGQQWLNEGTLVAIDSRQTDSFFGQSVTIRGTTAIVGAWARAEGQLWGAGAAYVFEHDGNAWNQVQKLLPSVARQGAQFGCSVSIGEGFVVIGANGDDENGEASGAAYIFRDTGGGWIQEARLVQQAPEAGDGFGWSVDASGDAVIISCHNDNAGVGSAYIYRYSGSAWDLEAILTASDGVPADLFGWDVAMRGSIAVAGARQDSALAQHAGSAYVFRHDGNEWIEDARLLAPDGDGSDYFGSSVAIADEDTIITATKWADQHGTMSGAAYAYHHDGARWGLGVRLAPPAPESFDEFGAAATAQSGTAVIGASGVGPLGEGAAYVFSLDCAGNDYRLAVGGACPGPITIEWSGADPAVQQALVFGLDRGSTTIPPGLPCAGTVLGVERSLRLVSPPGVFSTGGGSGMLTGRAGAGACGGYVQLVQGSDCTTSNAAMVPR